MTDWPGGNQGAIEMNWLRAHGLAIHWWIWVYGAITIAGSAVGILSGLGNFGMFYGDAIDGLDTSHPVVAHLGGMWASKNIGYVAALAAGFALRKAWVLAPIFAMKFVNDTVDMFIIGPQHLAQPFGQIVLGWLILGLPSALAAWHLIHRWDGETR